ncbi:IS21 family transposase [Promicromonospora vindobonensis]|uniref:IS21 family transposase n=1 Tax=Promicromonospora vindobonensis TaxID=195748 RepID=A0ABW5W2T1_9MICO
MAAQSRAQLFAQIRRDYRAGTTKRALKRKYHVAFETVEAALDSAFPQPRRPLPDRGSRLDQFKPLVDQWLRADLKAPRKQRHTAKRIFDRLRDEHDADVSYFIVKKYVAMRREEVRIEAGLGPSRLFVPQTHVPGAEAEVDFGDVTIELAGKLVVCSLFSFRLSFSGKAAHQVFASGGQEAFLEGHVHAFRVLGGLPVGKVRYDNLKAAIAQVLGFSRARKETERWTLFRSHYGLDAFYCQPGLEGAHEKGGVEGQVGWFRRNHFVPVPKVATLAELNEMVDAWDRSDDARRIGGRARTVGEMFAIEQPLLAPLPDEEFETGKWSHQRVDRYAQINVRTNRYSVPVRFASRKVSILLRASDLTVYDGRTQIARHERLPGKMEARLDLDHYLEALIRKPGAMPGATALEQARAAGRFTAVHDAWWDAVRRAHGDAEGTRALIEVLLLHRHMAHEHVVAGLTAALAVGAMTADAVALEARKAAEEHRTGEPTPLPDRAQLARQVGNVTSLTERRLRHQPLPDDTRPMPDMSKYDDLLPSRRRRRDQAGD